MSEAPHTTTPIRVAMMITELELGGAEQRFCDIACGLDRGRFQPFVFSLGPAPSAPRDGLLRRLQEHDIPVQFANASGLRQLRRAVSSTADWLREIKPDVAQTFLFHANVLGGRAAARARVPFALGIRVADPRNWRSWLERRISRRAARVICVSNAVREFAIQRGFEDSKLQVIANGVSPPQGPFASRSSLAAECEIPSVGRWLISVGRLHEQKGVDWLVEQAQHWLAPLPNCQLLLVGAGPLESQLRKAIADQQLQDRIHLVGWKEDVASWIHAADLLLLPSRWEGMPNVVMEAMSLAKPVLCGKAEGVTDLLGANAETQTAPFGDVSAWRSRIAALLSDSEVRSGLGGANQQQIQRHFSADRMIEQFESLFETIKNQP